MIQSWILHWRIRKTNLSAQNCDAKIFKICKHHQAYWRVETCHRNSCICEGIWQSFNLTRMKMGKRCAHASLSSVVYAFLLQWLGLIHRFLILSHCLLCSWAVSYLALTLTWHTLGLTWEEKLSWEISYQTSLQACQLEVILMVNWNKRVQPIIVPIL